MNAELAKAIPTKVKILVAGCGTGYQAADIEIHYPAAAVTAIDIGDASLDYARRQCQVLGIKNVNFINLDLHAVDALGQYFPRHLLRRGSASFAPSRSRLKGPDRGNIMVYNRAERLLLAGALGLGDLLQQSSEDDDLVREARRRFLEHPEHPLAAYVLRCSDFASLAGTRDLLLHPHVDSV